jgi:hypothetical protein
VRCAVVAAAIAAVVATDAMTTDNLLTAVVLYSSTSGAYTPQNTACVLLQCATAILISSCILNASSNCSCCCAVLGSHQQVALQRQCSCVLPHRIIAHSTCSSNSYCTPDSTQIVSVRNGEGTDVTFQYPHTDTNYVHRSYCQ